MKDARIHSDDVKEAALARSRAATYQKVVDAGIFTLPVLQIGCLANGHYKTAAALGAVVVVSGFLHNHFFEAAQPPLIWENTALGNFRRLML